MSGGTEQKVDLILNALTEWGTQLTGFKTSITTLERNQNFLLELVRKLQSEVEELKKKTPQIQIPSPVKPPVVSPIPKGQTLERLLMDISSNDKPRECSSLRDSLTEFKNEARTSAKSPSICSLAARNNECSELKEVAGIACKRDCVGAMPNSRPQNYKKARELAIKCGYDHDEIPNRFKD